MEKLADISLQQQSGSTAALTPSVARLSAVQRRQVGNLLANMAAGYPHQEETSETAEVYQLAFEDLAMEFGMPMLERSLRGFLSRQKFFPHPSEVRVELDEMAKKAKAEAAKGLPKVGCEVCMPEGNGFAGTILKLNTANEREAHDCECLLAHRRAKKAAEV